MLKLVNLKYGITICNQYTTINIFRLSILSPKSDVCFLL